MAALDQEDPRNVAIRQNEAEARYMRQTTPKERAMDQRASFDEAALRQRSEVAAQRLGMEQQRVNIAEGRAGLSELRMKIAEEKAKLSEADALSKAKRELTVMQEASGFLRDAVGMDPTKPEFDGQFQKMLSGYPNAAESKSVKEWIDYHRPIAEARRAEQAKIATEKRAMEAAELERARLAGISPEMPVTQVVSDGVTRKMPDAAKPNEDDSKRLSHLESLRMKKDVDVDVKAYLDQEILRLKGTQKPVEAQPQFTVGNPNGTPAAIVPTAPSSSAIRMKYVDGKLVPAS